LTGGVFAKTFDVQSSQQSFSCITILGKNTSLDLKNFTISNLENCTGNDFQSTTPLVAKAFCDSDLYNIIQTIDHRLLDDKLAFNRDFIGKI